VDESVPKKVNEEVTTTLSKQLELKGQNLYDLIKTATGENLEAMKTQIAAIKAELDGKVSVNGTYRLRSTAPAPLWYVVIDLNGKAFPYGTIRALNPKDLSKEDQPNIADSWVIESK
jgi:hypothetical protein